MIWAIPGDLEETSTVQPALVEPLRRWDPEQLGGYVLLGRLGAGAMGQVYLGRSAAGRLVGHRAAGKTSLADALLFKAGAVERQEADGRVGQALEHLVRTDGIERGQAVEDGYDDLTTHAANLARYSLGVI